jgi:transcription antitermination factor NusG
MSAVPWFVLQVLTNHEKRVSQQLSIRSIENYLPTYLERSKWSDRTVTLERPLFPGYVFARFAAGSRLDAIGLNGVLRLVGGRDTDRVDADEIERIQAAISAGYVLRPGQRMKSGTQVRLRTGIFARMHGIVKELNKDCSVNISLRNANHAFTVVTSIEDLDILSASIAMPFAACSGGQDQREPIPHGSKQL